MSERVVSPCPNCGGDGWVQDETACGDPDHCASHRRCECNTDDHITWDQFIDDE